MEDLTKGLKKAREHLAQGKPQEALPSLMHLTEKYPDNREVKSAIAAALNLRGIAQAEAGAMDRAGIDFERSLRYQETADAHVSMGRLHQSRGQFQEAFQEYTRALDLDEDLATAHEYLGYYFLEVGDPDQAVTAFHDDLAAYGMADRVLVATWSEFGRRAQETGNAGTDHGTAAPMFLIGDTVKGGMYGQAPSLAVGRDGNLKYTVDFRAVYQEILESHMKVDATEVLSKRYERIPAVAS